MYSELNYIDLSKVACSSLGIEVNSIIDHHKKCAVFLGHLEPGWMLEPQIQVQLRKLFRKFPVGIVCEFSESLPFSWKNEIEVLYTSKSTYTNGDSLTINNGGALHNKLEI